jgi:hypothetical protein
MEIEGIKWAFPRWWGGDAEVGIENEGSMI